MMLRSRGTSSRGSAGSSLKPGSKRPVKRTFGWDLNEAEAVSEADLPETLRQDLPRYGGARVDLPADGIVLEQLERGLIEEALRRSQGNQTAAARFLGISRSTLIYRMQKFGLK
jgi:two-component system NtrC family response regulator